MMMTKKTTPKAKKVTPKVAKTVSTPIKSLSLGMTIAVVIMAVTIGASVTYIFMNKRSESQSKIADRSEANKAKVISEGESTEELQPTSVPTSAPSSEPSIPPASDESTHLAFTEEFMKGYQYPKDMNELTYSDIDTTLACSGPYSAYGNNVYKMYDEKTNKEITLTNKDVLAYTKSAEDIQIRSIQTISVCTSKTGVYMPYFDKAVGASGYTPGLHLAQIPKGKTYIDALEHGLIDYSFDQMGVCTKILALVPKETAYVECSFGDAGFSNTTIMKNSLNNTYSSKAIMSCDSQYDMDNPNAKPKVTCTY